MNSHNTTLLKNECSMATTPYAAVIPIPATIRYARGIQEHGLKTIWACWGCTRDVAAGQVMLLRLRPDRPFTRVSPG